MYPIPSRNYMHNIHNADPPHIHEQSLQGMLRKARQQQHNRKAKQHNTTCPKQSFFKEKLAASGGTWTHDHQLSRWRSYQLSYQGSSVSWAQSCIQITCIYTWSLRPSICSMMALAFLFEEPRNELDLATPWREWDTGLYQRDTKRTLT